MTETRGLASGGVITVFAVPAARFESAKHDIEAVNKINVKVVD